MTTVAGKIVVLGLAGIDWPDLSARASGGQIPAIASLIARGAAGRLLAPEAPHGPVAWATLATGLGADRHGMILREEPWAGGLRPVGRAAWKIDPVWLRLADAGIATAGVGWPGTAPGETWPGVHVDERFPLAGGRAPGEWLLPPGVAPPDWLETLRDLRMHPLDVTGAMLAPFVPALKAVDQARDHRLVDLALMVAELSTGHAAATALLEEAPWQALFVHHRWIEAVHARFGKAAPPFGGVVDAAWTLLDALVGAVAAALPDDATILLVSPGNPGRAGIMIAAGPRIASGQVFHAAQARDVVPTLLAQFGYADPSLPGRALLSHPAPLRDLGPGGRSMTDVTPHADDLARVAAFGHVPPQVPHAWQARKFAAEAQILLARDPAAAGRRADAALALDPTLIPALGVRAAAHVAAEEAEPLPELADRIDAAAPGHLWASLVRAGYHALRGEASLARPYLKHVEAEGGPEELLRVAAAWMMLKRPADAGRAFETVLASQPDNVSALVGLAIARADRPLLAEPPLRRVLDLDPTHQPAREVLAGLLRGTGRATEAVVIERS